MEQGKIPLSHFFSELASRFSGETASLGKIFDVLAERGVGLLSLFITATYLIPVPMPGLSFVLALTLVFCSLLLIFKTKLFIPQFLHRYKLKVDLVQKILIHLSRFFKRSEKIVKPRGEWLIPFLGGRFLVGFILLISALVFMLPLPLGLNIPTACMALLVTWGYLEDDAYAILAGLVLFLGQILCLIWMLDFFLNVLAKFFSQV